MDTENYRTPTALCHTHTDTHTQNAQRRPTFNPHSSQSRPASHPKETLRTNRKREFHAANLRHRLLTRPMPTGVAVDSLSVRPDPRTPSSTMSQPAGSSSALTKEPEPRTTNPLGCRWARERPHKTARSWQLLERTLTAMRWLLRATSRSRKRRAFWVRLSLRLNAEPRRRAASASPRRRRICRITPSNSSVTLCCRDADVSMNLQSKTTAHARPSGKKTNRRELMNVICVLHSRMAL